MLGYPHEELIGSQTLERIILVFVIVDRLELIVILHEEVQQVLLRWGEAVDWDLIELSGKSLFILDANFKLNHDRVYVKQVIAQFIHDMMELNFILPAKNLQ
jgi:hypothetical protein